MSRPRECGSDPIGSQLGRPVPAPDLTGPVMRRLGLGVTTRQRARRRRAGRVVVRVLLCGLAVAATVLAVSLVERQRRPSSPAPTLPAALQHDLQHHGRTIDRAIKSIRELSPALTAEPPDDQTP